jgi:hypothetical protein
MTILERWRKKLSVKADLREGATGWAGWPAGSADRGAGERQRLYADALQAWRENPYAKRIIDLITDYTVGDGLTPLAPGEMGRFIDTFWHHPQNRLDLRLPELVDELSRAGDLFLALFRNPADGMSYVRAVPKSEIVEIVTADNDWEREVAYVVTSDELRTTSEERASELVTRHSSLESFSSLPTIPTRRRPRRSWSTIASTGRWGRCWASRSWRPCCPGCAITAACSKIACD